MSFVSKTSVGGFPQYVLENIPPESDYRLTVNQPAIYYGESMPGYRIVGTGVKELDYPKGNQNVYTSYQGKGGIPLDSFWKRLLFAWTQADVNILLTSYLQPESRIQIWRRVQERVAADRSFFATRQRSLCRAERGQAVLDPGCLHGLRSLSLLQSPHGGLSRKA